jgi:lipopolysaccharide/colanic/teichoic acid biosynthesis glycosyltransferase
MSTPIFFSQERMGKNGEPFRLLKFRTMTHTKNAEHEITPSKERVTKLGAILRDTSLDELPQLLCILQGKMSFVGPRPLPVAYHDYLTRIEHRRHEVKPGLTGLAQVNGRNELSWEEKFNWDLKYIENWNLRGDLNILIKTIYVVLSRKGNSINRDMITTHLAEERSQNREEEAS